MLYTFYECTDKNIKKDSQNLHVMKTVDFYIVL